MPGSKYATTRLQLWDSYGNGFSNIGVQNPYASAPPPGINSFKTLEYGRSANGSDSDELQVEILGHLDRFKLQDNNRIIAWRNFTDDNGQTSKSIGLQTTWFIKDWDKGIVRGLKTTKIIAVPAVRMLSWRVVGYTDGVTGKERFVNVAADDILKNFVTGDFVTIGAIGVLNNIPDNGPNRSISPYLTVEANRSAAPVTTMYGAWKELSAMFKDICNSSATAGTFLYYDVVSPTASTLEFRTYTGQRGSDRTLSGGRPFYFKVERGNIIEAHRERDTRKTYNFVYCLGKMDGTLRTMRTSYDASQITSNAFGRREKVIKAQHADTLAHLQAEADKELQKSRPVDIFSAKIKSGGSSTFGKDWDFGDRVMGVFDGETFPCRVDAVKIKVDGHTGEQVDVLLRNDNNVQ